MAVRIRNILEVLAQYDVSHVRKIERDDLGRCDFDTMHIRVSNRQPLIQRVDTLIHEVLHAHYDSIGIDASETRVLRETKQIMKRLYGNTYAM